MSMEDETETAAPETTETAPPEAPETPAEAVPEEPEAPPQPDAAEKALAAKHAELRRHKRDLEARYADGVRQLEAERASVKAELEVIAQLRGGDILGALEALQVTPERIVQALEEAATLPPDVRKMKAEMAAMKAEREREQREAQERARREQATASERATAAQIAEAVKHATDPRIVAFDDSEKTEFARALFAETKRVLAQGKRANLDEIAETLFGRLERAAKLAAKWQAPPAAPVAAAKAKPKTPGKPGGAAPTLAAAKDLSIKDAVKLALSASPAELEEVARGTWR